MRGSIIQSWVRCVIGGVVLTSGMTGCGDPELVKILQAKADILSLETQVQAYFRRMGKYPTNSSGLADLVRNPDPGNGEWTKLLDELPKDPWGRGYQYPFPGSHSSKPFEIYSLGVKPSDPSQWIGNWQEWAKKE